MKQFHAIVIGATGAVGQFLVSQLLENSRIKSVTIFVRKNITSQNKKLIVHKIDFSNIGEHSDKIVGDVSFEEVKDKVKAITPVPGGVGPMTIACLLKNTLECFKARLT